MTTSSNPHFDIVARLQDASERKSDGNDHFRQARWNEALIAYQAGLNRLPQRRSEADVTSDVSEDDDNERHHSVATSIEGDPAEESLDANPGGGEVLLSEDNEREVMQLRSVLYANIAACHVKLGEHKEAVHACTQGMPLRSLFAPCKCTRDFHALALKDNPTYEKALHRRATANETINTWSSLTAAQEDYKALQQLAKSSLQKSEIETKLKNLQPRLEAAQKKETAEMVDKLKGFGNSILGRFGLSTDNFKFEPNGQGGYSMNFVQ
ncbi:phosphoprotein phosphatase, variant 2 [Coprinopsis cinerea AmutBmut pab1-1]|nr:phosphoprotein phosphatase, variant 2 [Coprinopsis cinerea AmutBmut pab1-1]